MGTFANEDVLYTNNPSPSTGTGLLQMRQNQKAIKELVGASAPATLEIVDGSITPTSAFVLVDTEGQAAADDLTVINVVVDATNTLHDGMLLYLQAADAGRVVTVKNSSSANGILTADGNDVVLDTTNWYCVQLRQGTWWEVADLRSFVVADAAQTTADNAVSAAATAQSSADAAAAAAAVAATTTALGRARLATTAEVQAGAADAGSVSPAVLRPEDIALFPVVLGGAMLYNTREVLTTSGSWIAPVTGWYRLLLIGGGGGGSFGWAGTGGGGGGSGERKELFLYVTKDTSCSYAIGAPGIGGNRASNTLGTDGGATTFVHNGTTYQAEGGYAPKRVGSATHNSTNLSGKGGGSGLSAGFSGESGAVFGGNYNGPGGTGGGPGGGVSSFNDGLLIEAFGYGAGGAGGGATGSVYVGNNGGNGYQGCIVIDYFDPAKAA